MRDIQLVIILLLVIGLFACNERSDSTRVLQLRISSLENKLSEIYKPGGFGEFMTMIQIHHIKLWFAGENENWKLADFEVHEIMEAIGDIQKYQKERQESQVIDMINPVLDCGNQAIKRKNLVNFESNYTLLTNTCNKCHHATDFEFNVVKIPDKQPFSNQDFRIAR